MSRTDDRFAGAFICPGLVPVWGTRSARIILLITLLVAGALRFYRLDLIPGFNGDEAMNAVRALRLLNHGEFFLHPTQPYLGPLFVVLLAASQALLGASILAVRLVPAAAGLAAVAAAYALGARAYGMRVGLLFAGALAVFPMHVGWSRIAMDVSLLPLVNILLFLALHAWLQSGRRRWLAAAAALLGTGCTLHPMEFLAIPGIAGALLLIPEARRKIPSLLVATILVLVCALPVLGFPLSALSGTGPVGAVGDVPRGECLSALVRTITGRQIYDYFGGYATPAGKVGIARDVLLAGATLGGFVLCLARRRPLDLLLAGSTASLVGGVLLCKVPLFVLGAERYLLGAAPALCFFPVLFLAWAAARRATRAVAALTLAAMASWPVDFCADYFGHIMATGGTGHRAFVTGVREIKCEAARYLAEGTDRFPPDNTAIFCEDWWLYWPIRFFLKDAYAVNLIPLDPGAARRQISAVMSAEPGWNKVFVVFEGSDVAGLLARMARENRAPPSSLARFRRDNGAPLVDLLIFPATQGPPSPPPRSP